MARLRSLSVANHVPGTQLGGTKVRPHTGVTRIRRHTVKARLRPTVYSGHITSRNTDVFFYLPKSGVPGWVLWEGDFWKAFGVGRGVAPRAA